MSDSFNIILSPQARQILGSTSNDDLLSCTNPSDPTQTLNLKSESPETLAQDSRCKISLPAADDTTWIKDTHKHTATLRFTSSAANYIASLSDANGNPLKDHQKIKPVYDALINTWNRGTENGFYLTDETAAYWRDQFDPEGNYFRWTDQTITYNNGRLYEYVKPGNDPEIGINSKKFKSFATNICRWLEKWKEEKQLSTFPRRIDRFYKALMVDGGVLPEPVAPKPEKPTSPKDANLYKVEIGPKPESTAIDQIKLSKTDSKGASVSDSFLTVIKKDVLPKIKDMIESIHRGDSRAHGKLEIKIKVNPTGVVTHVTTEGFADYINAKIPLMLQIQQVRFPTTNQEIEYIVPVVVTAAN